MFHVIQLHLKEIESMLFFSTECDVKETSNGHGIITAIKKHYKHLLINEIIAYHDTAQFLKDQLFLAVERMKQRAAGIVYGRPPHFLDAANLVKMTWNEISSQSLKNCFKKADIISSFRD